MCTFSPAHMDSFTNSHRKGNAYSMHTKTHINHSLYINVDLINIDFKNPDTYTIGKFTRVQ